MMSADDLIPELAQWNGGDGVDLTDWTWMTGRTDHAMGFAALFWPELVEFDGYVLRAPVDVERLRSWEAASRTRAQIEIVMNLLPLDFTLAFRGDDDAAEPYREARLRHIASAMADMLSAKLQRDFPSRSFEALVIGENEDFGVSFRQL